ncbi:stromal cell-derived factor 2-like protein 1 [Contarinia nasturtii]|uniref:stromal cell-derived factor 2-like protein 1 n=1 Tax=Contarinia nasturtii TaxID=265458 RepID=UPI0012D37574|nr:stromal cell-derived factor 2-like protein 1 [Contarinia nasturtii]
MIVSVDKLVIFICAFIQCLNLSVASHATQFVTYGSVLKILNTDYNVRLHSHDVKYGTGSGQQSITGTELKEDINSHWTILNLTSASYQRGQPVKCGDTIRLQHLSTKKNLHSHHFQSPLSGNQEISCYGEDGVGDSGDNWKVICSDDVWNRSNSVKFQHIDTDAYLSVSGRTFGRPINGQMEIVGVTNSYKSTEWKAAEGIFVHPSQQPLKKHDEL